MSEEKIVSGEPTQEPGGLEAEGVKKDQVQYETYRKVLSEKKRRDQEVGELKAQIEALQQSELEKTGKVQEALDMAKKKVVDLESAQKKDREKFAWHSVSSQVKQIASQMGCIDPDALMKLVKFDIEVRDDFTSDPEAVKAIVSDSQKTFSYLFKREVVGVKDLPPGNNQPKPKPASERSQEELMNMLKTGQFRT